MKLVFGVDVGGVCFFWCIKGVEMNFFVVDCYVGYIVVFLLGDVEKIFFVVFVVRVVVFVVFVLFGYLEILNFVVCFVFVDVVDGVGWEFVVYV